MADTADFLDGLSEVSRMATLLAGDVLHAQIMGRSIPDSHIRALLDAAVLLKEHGLDLPPLLGQLMLGAEGPEPQFSPDARQRV